MKTPEIEKLKAVKAESQTIGEFLEWLDNRGYRVAKYKGQNLIETEAGIQQLLAQYFEIDLKKVDQEKDAILEEWRKMNKL